jgi:hypothetical protein
MSAQPKSLFEKVWDAHAVRTLANGQTQLLIGTHLIHEVTSPQAFGMLRDLGLKVAFPHRTFATVDHIVPTNELVEPYKDNLAQAMMDELRNITKATASYPVNPELLSFAGATIQIAGSTWDVVKTRDILFVDLVHHLGWKQEVCIDCRRKIIPDTYLLFSRPILCRCQFFEKKI